MIVSELEDAAQRTQIIESDGNTVVLASAGTGKTYMMIEKLIHLTKNDNGFKKLAAITYTEKAANEIKERLESRNAGSRVVSSTLHRWIMKEIINPFVRNKYDIPSEISLKFVFKNNIDTFEEGISLMQEEGVINEYEKSEADKGRDFAFQLALDILQNSKSAKRYLKATYSWIFVDEYQDVNRDQHALVKFIVDELNIKAFIVGDNKQQIYSFRGSNTEYLNSFREEESFTELQLTHNFRSKQDIVAYSRLFDDEYQFSSGYSQSKNRTVVNLTTHKIEVQELVNKIMEKRPSESIMILKRANFGATKLKESNGVFNDFQTNVNLAYSESEYSDFFSLLIKILHRKESIYALQKYFAESLIHQNFANMNKLIENFYTSHDVKMVRQLLELISEVSEINLSPDEIEKFLAAVVDDEQVNYVLGAAEKYMILTIHRAKGLEADNVIIDSSDFFSIMFFNHKHTTLP